MIVLELRRDGVISRRFRRDGVIGIPSGGVSQVVKIQLLQMVFLHRNISENSNTLTSSI